MKKITVSLLIVVLIAGCTTSNQSKIDKAEVLYTATLDISADMANIGIIDLTTARKIEKARLIAKGALIMAQAYLDRGELKEFEAIMDNYRTALIELNQILQEVKK